MNTAIETIPTYDTYDYNEEEWTEVPGTSHHFETFLAAAGLGLVASSGSDLKNNRKGRALFKIGMGRALHHISERIGLQSEDVNNTAITLGRVASITANGLLTKEGMLSKRRAVMLFGKDIIFGFSDFIAYNRQRTFDRSDRQAKEALGSSVMLLSAVSFPEANPILDASIDTAYALLIRESINTSAAELKQMEPVKYSGSSPRPLR